ncbi:hypothetical protein SCLCIDRAFT_1223222 [Scleroderma citrinum Foug A]|uniref:Uncharacterized protein n=1 Tax=Scleroderma citrinum Foug A TaxID=1036808 RepID=A0A0C2YTQ6_9AGAM|nr:hypothetical protein SCLCIDRAFT_1223222 [Scleroderma citrinum Foug A]
MTPPSKKPRQLTKTNAGKLRNRTKLAASRSIGASLRTVQRDYSSHHNQWPSESHAHATARSRTTPSNCGEKDLCTSQNRVEAGRSR